MIWTYHIYETHEGEFISFVLVVTEWPPKIILYSYTENFSFWQTKPYLHQPTYHHVWSNICNNKEFIRNKFVHITAGLCTSPCAHMHLTLLEEVCWIRWHASLLCRRIQSAASSGVHSTCSLWIHLPEKAVRPAFSNVRFRFPHQRYEIFFAPDLSHAVNSC